MYDKITQLAKLNRNAKTAEEKEHIRKEMKKLKSENPSEYASALKSLIVDTAKDFEELTMAEKL